jgi:hypothetical protein
MPVAANPVIPGRMTAEIDGDFVVFVIGMRINRWWKVQKWLPVALAMGRMLRELHGHPDSGFLGARAGLRVSVQYWRSFEHLDRYARDPAREHWPAWVEFNRRVRASSGDVGIWHETFLVRAGQYEALYASMPREGLAAAGRYVPVARARESARARVAGGGAHG